MKGVLMKYVSWLLLHTVLLIISIHVPSPAQEFGVAVKPMASEDQPVVAGGVTVNIMARVPEQAKKSK